LCNLTAAEATAKRKEDKSTEIACNYHFFPIAFETIGPIDEVGTEFISALMRYRISSITDDPRETFSLFRRLYVANQRGLMLSGLPIHSALLMGKYNVTSRSRNT